MHGSLSPLDAQDAQLIAVARAAIRRGYDAVSYRHTVGAAVLCGSGAVYTGVNVYSLHGACAEQVAIGAAAAHGEHLDVNFCALFDGVGQTEGDVKVRAGSKQTVLCPDGGLISSVLYPAWCGAHSSRGKAIWYSAPWTAW